MNGNKGILDEVTAANHSAQAGQQGQTDASVLKQMHYDRLQISDVSEVNGLDMEKVELNFADLAPGLGIWLW